MRAYFLLAGATGMKTPAAGAGFHFHGDMRQFADYLAVQLSIPIADDPTQPVRAGGPALPVLDKTGLSGTYDFTVDARPEPGSPAFSTWQRALREQLGLFLDSRRGPVEVIVVDAASKIPTGN